MVKGKNKNRFAADREVDALAIRMSQLEKEVEEIKKHSSYSICALPSSTIDYGVALASRSMCDITRDLPPMPRAKRIKNGKISTDNKTTK